MDECIDSLREATIFSIFDENSGYWQIEIDPRDCKKTVFTSHRGLFQCTRMPFGLQNAPATFQRATDVISALVKWQAALVYLHDIVVFSKSITEHAAHLRTVLTHLKNSAVVLKLKSSLSFLILSTISGT